MGRSLMVVLFKVKTLSHTKYFLATTRAELLKALLPLHQLRFILYVKPLIEVVQ